MEEVMTIRRIFMVVASALALAGTTHAAELAPIQPQSIDLGEVSGVAYYTAERDGFHVVATLAQGETGTPVRFQAVLDPGQSLVLSTPRGVGLPPVAVRISRRGNSLLVEEPATD
jgi:hypothetical protein